MNRTANLYEAARRPLESILEAVPAGRWSSPSPCEGWSLRDVLKHMIDTQRDFLRRSNVDLASSPDTELDPAAGWKSHAQQVAEVLADDSLASAEFDGYFGPTTVGATLEQFYIWDMLVHRWDIAHAVDAPARFSEGELDLIQAGADSFGEALYMDGICRPGVEVPADADRESRVLARLGRKV